MNVWAIIGLAATAKINMARCQRVIDETGLACGDYFDRVVHEAAVYSLFQWTEKYATYRQIYIDFVMAEIESDMADYESLNRKILLDAEADAILANGSSYYGVSGVV